MPRTLAVIADTVAALLAAADPKTCSRIFRRTVASFDISTFASGEVDLSDLGRTVFLRHRLARVVSQILHELRTAPARSPGRCLEAASSAVHLVRVAPRPPLVAARQRGVADLLRQWMDRGACGADPARGPPLRACHLGVPAPRLQRRGEGGADDAVAVLSRTASQPRAQAWVCASPGRADQARDRVPAADRARLVRPRGRPASSASRSRPHTSISRSEEEAEGVDPRRGDRSRGVSLAIVAP